MNNLKTIVENNLTIAWAKAFLKIMMPGIDTLEPFVVSIFDIDNNEPIEVEQIKDVLNGLLRENNSPTISETAATIFPFRAWKFLKKPKCDEFSHWYLNNYLPRHRARIARIGRKWKTTYFERMIDFHGMKEVSGAPVHKPVNQLQYIIELWKKNHGIRQSALQVGILDPAKDHTGAIMSGFPCLQQVSIGHDQNGNLSLNAYYPAQYIIDRAYGNYLGLCHLGLFMAKEMDLKFTRFNCFIGHPQRGGFTKGRLRNLEKIVNDLCK